VFIPVSLSFKNHECLMQLVSLVEAFVNETQHVPARIIQTSHGNERHKSYQSTVMARLSVRSTQASISCAVNSSSFAWTATSSLASWFTCAWRDRCVVAMISALTSYIGRIVQHLEPTYLTSCWADVDAEALTTWLITSAIAPITW